MEIVEGRATLLRAMADMRRAESSVTIPARRTDDPLERTRKPAARSCEEVYAERKALLSAARDAGLSTRERPA